MVCLQENEQTCWDEPVQACEKKLYLSNPGNTFCLNKTSKKKKKFSHVLSKLSLHKVLGSLLGKVPSWLILHTPKKEKYVWGQSTKVHFGSAVFVRTRLWAKEGCEYDWSFPFSKKRILRNLTGLERLSSFLGHGA